MRKGNYEKLKEAFLELLSKKHIYEIEIKELAERAGLNRTTIYRHYGSNSYAKNYTEVITSCYDEIVLETRNNLIESLLPDESGDFEEMYEQLFSCIEENADVLKVLLGPTAPPSFENELLSLIKDRYLLNINKLFSEFCKWEKNKKRLDDCATFFSHGTIGLLKEWLFSDCVGKEETLKSINLLDEAIEKLFI